jgi:hypothetical protein
MFACALGLAAAACTSSSGSSRDGLSSTDPDSGEGEVCLVEAASIGIVGEVPTHGTTLSVTRWTPKANAKGKYIGFQLSRPARFTVLIGANEFQSEGSSWTHPAGVNGDAITGIDFCDDYCEDEGDNGGFPDID